MKLGVLALVLASSLALSSQVSANALRQYSLEEKVAASDAVVIGTVVAITKEHPADKLSEEYATVK